MSSPAETYFNQQIKIDKSSKTPIYIQVTQQIINAIQRSYLTEGTQLPGTRKLSEILNVNRQTIVMVYNELEASNWVSTKPNLGTYVLQQDNFNSKVNPFKTLISLEKYPEKTAYQFKASNILDSPFENKQLAYNLNDGLPDYRLIQIENLSSLYSASLKRKSNQKKSLSVIINGSSNFKDQLSNFLNQTRCLHISKKNLLITRSTEMSLYIISKLIIEENETVLVGNISFFTSNMIFKHFGANIQTVPVDEDGIDVDYIRENYRANSIRMVYVTPQHHYPTTSTLSAQRRIDLLQLAQEYGFIIIEDEYDFDFKYERDTIMPLASGDVSGNVVYLGTFGKPLAPSFRAGFVVAPQNLIVEAEKLLGVIDRQGDYAMEQALAELIEEGTIHRLLKKSMVIYKERRDHCAMLLAKYFKDEIEFEVPKGGLAIWVKWKNPISLSQLSKTCQTRDLFIPKNILYQNRDICAIRLGFGHLSTNEMEKTIIILKMAYLQLKNNYSPSSFI